MAIIPILSYILERAMFIQVIEYMTTNNLLHPNHHTYKKNHNTTTALIQMYDTWVEAADRGEMTGVCLLDQSAAFDVVDPDLFLEKLKLYGFQQDTTKRVRSYLSGRIQCVSIDG